MQPETYQNGDDLFANGLGWDDLTMAEKVARQKGGCVVVDVDTRRIVER